MMIGQSATGQVELRPFINYLWCSLKFFPLFAIIKSLWRSCEVQWCDLLRLWSVQTFCQSLSTHNQGHEIYNLSEKELLYKQRISLELLEVKSILSLAFKILCTCTWQSSFKIKTLLDTPSRRFCLKSFSPQVANRISPGISRLRGVILYELQVEHFQQLWSWSLAWSWLCCWRWLSNHGETSEDLFQ